jgi:hypothetical protein
LWVIDVIVYSHGKRVCNRSQSISVDLTMEEFFVFEGTHGSLNLDYIVEKMRDWIKWKPEFFSEEERRVLDYMVNQTQPRYNRYLVDRYREAYRKEWVYKGDESSTAWFFSLARGEHMIGTPVECCWPVYQIPSSPPDPFE